MQVKRLVVGKGRTSRSGDYEEWTKEYFEVDSLLSVVPTRTNQCLSISLIRTYVPTYLKSLFNRLDRRVIYEAS